MRTMIRERLDLLGIPATGKAVIDAGLLGVIRSIMQGSSPTLDNWERVCRFLNIHIQYNTGEDIYSFTTEIPVHGYVGAGGETAFLPSEVAIDTIEVPTFHANLIGLEVRGNSMAPVYNEGDIVFIDTAYPPAPALNGVDCVIELSDARGGYLKRLRVIGKGRTRSYMLESINPTHPPMMDVEILSARPVRWVHRR